MLSLVLRPLRSLVAVLLANDSPRQIAGAVALGVVLGLVPKGNLIAAALAALLLGLRFNRTAGLLAAGFASLVGPLTDGFTHKLGAKLLAIDPLQPAYAWLYDLPLGPWIGFNNTVVLGALVLGLYLTYPSYVLSRLLLHRFRAPVAAWLAKKKIARWLLGADVTSRLGMPTFGASA